MKITLDRDSRPLFVCLAAAATVVVGGSVMACSGAAAAVDASGQSAARAGYLVGRVVFPDGRPVPKFTIDVSGFAEGKVANTNAVGRITETVVSHVDGTNGHYEVALPAGAYRAYGWTTVEYQGRIYNFELQSTSDPAKFDYDGLGLEKLRGGIVRDFKTGMTDKKKDGNEDTETSYYHAYYGGLIRANSGQSEYQIGGGAQIPPSLHDSYPAASKIELTLTPQGLMVDGTTGAVVVRTLTLGDDGKWTFVLRGIYPGMYAATARLVTPTGEAVPLRISPTAGKTVKQDNGYDRMVVDWQTSVPVDFLPNESGPMPRMGVQDVSLYFGK